MKQLILTLSIFVLSFNLHAQTACVEYMQRIDSLIKNDASLNFTGRNSTTRPAISCESTLLDFTENKGYYGDSIDFQIREILFYISYQGSDKKDRTKAINALLDRSYAFCTNLSYEWQKKDVDQRARQHLVRLLKREYTPLEIERYIKEHTKYSLEPEWLDKESKSISEQKQQDQKQVKDSIIAAAIERNQRKLINEGYSPNLALLMGWLDMQESITLLDSMYRKDEDAGLAMALARLGDKEYQRYFETANKVYMDVAFYIGTQEMIYKYGKELYSKETRVYISGSPVPGGNPIFDADYYNPQIPIAYNVIIDFQNHIEHFPRLIERNTEIKFQDDLKKIPPGTLEKAQQWMEENKGRYILKDNFFPRFKPEMF